MVPNSKSTYDINMASLPSSKTALTHLLALLTGIAIGKSVDADELSAYRSSNDDLWSRMRRKMKNVLIGTVVLGLVYKTGSAAVQGLLGSGNNDSGDGSVERRSQ